jgi:hypothetical protein
VTPSSAIIAPGGIANSKLTVTTAASSLGNYTVLVRDTSGNLTHFVSVSVNIGDFGIAASPTIEFRQENDASRICSTPTSSRFLCRCAGSRFPFQIRIVFRSSFLAYARRPEA